VKKLEISSDENMFVKHIMNGVRKEIFNISKIAMNMKLLFTLTQVSAHTKP